MASLPTGSRKYGTTYVQVLYRLDGGQAATWFHDHASMTWRYYEQLGLISPKRAPNGYREYMDGDVSVVAEIRKLHALGIPPSKAYSFIDCLGAGHENADDCVTSLAVYRDSLIELNHMIASLTTRRDRIARRLTESASLQFFHRRPT